MSLSEARNIIDWMAKSEEEGGGGRRAEWVSSGGGKGEKNEAWIWWRRPEEWAAVVADWVSGLSLLFFFFLDCLYWFEFGLGCGYCRF